MQLDLFSNDNMLSTEQQQIVDLRAELEQHNRNYYILNQPTISDQEFDHKMRLLQDLEAKHPEMKDPNSPTQRVGSDLGNGAFRSIVHQYPMLSLANTYSEQEIRDWYERVLRGLGTTEPVEIVCELKFDGTSISLWYEHGELLHAVTRGDGVRGDDVTQNVRTIRTIPLKLDPATHYPDHFEIRGEILMPWSAFERLNAEREAQEEPLFANPRNAASGSLKLQVPAEVAKRGLDAYLYYLLGEQLPATTHYDNLQAARHWGFKISDAIRVCRSIDEIMDYINYWDTERRNLPVATDGIVLKVNRIDYQQDLGFTAKTPRWAIAYKFQAEQACTRLDSVSFQVGRRGTITPVANLEPVQLSGTIVKRATLHNEDFIRQLDLHIGDMVFVEKGGEIIPKITGVDLSQRAGGSEQVQFITHCPECGTPLIRYEGEAAHYCPNADHCPPQQKGKIVHFVSRKAMNIESIGEELIERFFSLGWIRDVADLYSIDPQQVARLERMGEKSAQNIMDALERSKQVPFERVLFAIGIPYVGETTAKRIARHFGSLDKLQQATEQELCSVEDVGEQIAKSVTQYFAKPENQQLIERLRQIGLRFEGEVEQVVGGALSGLNIVISGTFSLHSREEYKAMIEQNGGKNVGSVSSKTHYILAGDNMGPAKLEKAQKLGIQIINEQQFLHELLQQP